MNDLIELRQEILDAIDLLKQAARMAYEASGHEPGRAPCEWVDRLPCPDCNGTGYERPTTPLPEGIPWGDCPACGGKAYCEITHTEPGQPAVEGWPTMLRLSGDLDDLAAKVDEAFVQEIREACEAESAENDRLADLADGRSY